MTTLLGTHHTPTSKVLVAIALVAGIAISAFWMLFIAAEMVSDPGGWFGVLYAAALIVPVLILGVLAWFAPRIAAYVLTALVALYVAANLATMFFGTAWAGFEDTHGPIGLIVAVVLCVPALVLGREYPLLAGVLLLSATLVPVLVSIVAVWGLGVVGGGIAMVTVGMPFILGGVLLIIAGLNDRRVA